MSSKQTEFDKHMSAVAFAEAGEHDTAREIMEGTGSLPAGRAEAAKKKPILRTLFFGAVSISAYIILFKNEGLVTSVFTMGGWHAVFPVGAAFLFSFIHGAFASNLLSVLGLEAKK